MHILVIFLATYPSLCTSGFSTKLSSNISEYSLLGTSLDTWSGSSCHFVDRDKYDEEGIIYACNHFGTNHVVSKDEKHSVGTTSNLDKTILNTLVLDLGATEKKIGSSSNPSIVFLSEVSQSHKME